ncbi:SDR family NAD(P)-dependent oxidoreductase [Kocuria sp. M4R2S49]|uniref:SDR family NAD(P)-dependent oxidoreductase n=1 Tax=Kocuria rhizosphaericola TaxID=3376284 RepID=UPI00379F9BF5
MGRILITGGAGFVGANLVDALLTDGLSVTVFDSLARPGTERNLEWLESKHPRSLTFIPGDVRDAKAVSAACADADVIYHLAGQVAVTTSVDDPRSDFEVNALGTFNLLEGARASGRQPVVVFTSTNKVYGGMEDVEIRREPSRYVYRTLPGGIPESRPLDFHSPYGCSKGAADQYVRDYSRIYDLPTVVFRMSCIYGPHQFGNEDQGWLAHFMIAASLGKPISIYGDGLQVRDALYVGDLVRAFRLAVERIGTTAGQVYNIGGGPANTISVWSEFGPTLTGWLGAQPDVTFQPWRPGDQLCYISDVTKAAAEFDWSPEVDLTTGLRLLWEWVTAENGPRRASVHGPRPLINARRTP